MAEYTQNLGLELPTINEFYNVTDVVNKNNQKIDAVAHNENLLDNAWFVNPVNQRGKTSYTSTEGDVYGIDRWRIADSIMNVFSDKIRITDVIYQPLEMSLVNSMLGKKVTLSVLWDYGDMESITVDVPTELTSSWWFSPSANVQLALSTSGGQFRVGRNTETDIHAVKLEFGTASTLANDSAPNYATELLKCQRYYQKYNTSMNCRYISSSTLAQYWIDCKYSNMRTSPTIVGGTPSALNGGNSVLGRITNSDTTRTDLILLYVTWNSAPSDMHLSCWVEDLELSADL